jgi:lia operon protein LiaG
MKFGMKKFVLCLVIVMFGSFITAGIILMVTGNFSIATEKIDESKSFSPQEIDKIFIDVVSTDVNIIPADESEIRVHLYGEVSTGLNRDIPSLISYISGDELRVEIARPKTQLIGFSVWRTSLDLYIPEDSLELLAIETSSSDVSVSDLKVDRFDYQNISGNFRGDSLFSDDLKLTVTSGDINLVDYTGNLDINAVSGDIVLEEGRQNDNIEIITVSGSINIEQEDSSNIYIESTSGDVGVDLSENARFYLKAESVSGDIGNSFPIKITSSSGRSIEGIVVDDSKEIIIKTISGSIDIE